MERQITQSEVAAGAAEAERNDSYHVMPGIVVSYDATQETAKVQPGTNDVRFDIDTGARVSEPWETMPSIPVQWMRFGGFVIKGELQKGDPVLLVAFDLDPTPWRKAGRTLQPSDPGDTRRHGGGYWSAVPVNLLLGRPQGGVTGKLTIGVEGGAPIITIDGTAITLGSTGGARMAIGDLVDDVLNGLLAQLSAAPAPTAPLTPQALGVMLSAVFGPTGAVPTTKSNLVKTDS